MTGMQQDSLPAGRCGGSGHGRSRQGGREYNIEGQGVAIGIGGTGGEKMKEERVLLWVVGTPGR